jgi:hypothetical protein
MEIKFIQITKGAADATADIGLVNQFAKATLKPEDVYCFSMNICDNDIDTDIERFTDETLQSLAKMFVGKTMLTDHWRSALNQVARIYRTEFIDLPGKNAIGQQLKAIRADAYIPITESTQPLIDMIEAGIVKEVSVGARCKERNCSICGKPLSIDWYSWTWKCEDGHVKGEKYAGKLCYGNLEKPESANEVSFVAVPAQRRAGVTKAAGEDEHEIAEAFHLISTVDLQKFPNEVARFMEVVKKSMVSAEELVKRQKIAEEAKSKLRKGATN